MNKYDFNDVMTFLIKLTICVTLTVGLIGGDVLRRLEAQGLEKRVETLELKVQKLEQAINKKLEGSPSGLRRQSSDW